MLLPEDVWFIYYAPWSLVNEVVLLKMRWNVYNSSISENTLLVVFWCLLFIQLRDFKGLGKPDSTNGWKWSCQRLLISSLYYSRSSVCICLSASQDLLSGCRFKTAFVLHCSLLWTCSIYKDAGSKVWFLVCQIPAGAVKPSSINV